MIVEVMADIFSGLPNPRWILQGTEAERVTNWLARLQPAAKGQKFLPPPDLGYRGFLIREKESQSGENWRSPFRVYGGLVAKRDQLLIDDSRSLEGWLLQSAGAQLEPQLREEIIRQLASENP
jgi:hypothetical protein